MVAHIFIHLAGPDGKALEETEELLHCEPWKVGAYQLNQLNRRSKGREYVSSQEGTS